MKKKDILVVLLVVLTLVIVFFDLFTLDKSFLSGDHREQQYPWAKFYQESVRSGNLPWWTTHNQCGFPLLAEGQIGAFYPLNYLFLKFLPVKWAYNYEILFQYFLGALFFYVFLRRKRVSEWGAFFATLIFLYGSTQGGYFYYNLISQKTVIWLPLTLMLIDGLAGKRALLCAFLLSAVFAVQIFAGYLQVAVYSVLFSCFYFVCVWFGDRRLRTLVFFFLSGLLALAISSVQLVPTFELAMLSSRAVSAKELAYVGSMTPAGFLTLFYPAWDGFLGSEFYLGLLGLFFVVVSVFSKKGSVEKVFLAGAGLFLLLALGKYSPLYRGLVELTGFGGFRTPIKFLFFVAFSCAVLAGFGFDKVFSGGHAGGIDRSCRRAFPVFLAASGLMLFFPAAVHHALLRFRGSLLPALQDFVVGQFFGKAGHPHSAEHYRDAAFSFYAFVIQSTSFLTKDNLVACLLILATMVIVIWLWRGKRPGRLAGLACVVLLFADLFFYGFTSIRPNCEPFDSIDGGPERSAITAHLDRDRSLFRVMEVYADPEENRKYPVFPDFNMLYHIDDIGIYTPLAMREYKSFLSGCGYVNDSISFEFVKPEKVFERLQNLNFLNVKYILSTLKLDHPGLSFVLEEKGVSLYENLEVVPRVFFLPGCSNLAAFEEVREFIPVPVSSYGQQTAVLEFDAPEDGLLVLTDTFYPGWVARVNGIETPILRAAKFFRSVKLVKGKNEVSFEYRPWYVRIVAGDRMGEP